MNEDEIIAEAFTLIRDGILTEDWQKILEAYKFISGEELELPVKKETRLEKIQKGIKKPPQKKDKNTKKEIEKVPEKNDEYIETISVKQKGGTNFAKDGFEVISVPEDENEKAKNKAISKKKVKMPRGNEGKDFEKKFNVDNPNREIGYSGNPKIAAPWH